MENLTSNKELIIAELTVWGEKWSTARSDIEATQFMNRINGLLGELFECMVELDEV